MDRSLTVSKHRFTIVPCSKYGPFGDVPADASLGMKAHSTINPSAATTSPATLTFRYRTVTFPFLWGLVVAPGPYPHTRAGGS
jgi:hypothetical protein